MNLAKKQIIIKLLVIIFTTSIMAFQCRKNCKIIPGKVDSIQTKIIQQYQNSTFSDTLALKDVMLHFSASLSVKDSNNLDKSICNTLSNDDTLQDLQIFLETPLNLNYPLGSNVTALFRIVQHDFSIDKPYYITIADFLSKKNSGIPQSILLAEPLTFDAPLPMQFKVVCTIKNLQHVSKTQTITITK